MKNNITFILFAYNEEKRIEYAIRNFVAHGEVLVLDGGSTDETRTIAESLGARFVTRPPSPVPQGETEEMFRFICGEVKTDWIYWGYVDNIAPRALVEKIVEVANENRYKKLEAPMHTYLWGRTDRPALHSSFPVAFHKDYMDFSRNYIHHLGDFTGKPSEALMLPNEDRYTLRHFSTYTIAKFVAGNMRYAEEESTFKLAKGERFSVIKMFAAMIRYCVIFWRCLFLGKVGLIIMLGHAFSRLMVYARLLEREQGITLDTVEENYSKAKEKLLTAASA